jgi:osmotically inducible lipoprotein OsmB
MDESIGRGDPHAPLATRRRAAVVRWSALVSLVLAIAVLAGCGLSGNQRRTLGGAALGAGTGAIIGGATGGNAGTGAAIGGAVGAVGGSLLGDDDDDRDYDRRDYDRRYRDDAYEDGYRRGRSSR